MCVRYILVYRLDGEVLPWATMNRIWAQAGVWTTPGLPLCIPESEYMNASLQGKKIPAHSKLRVSKESLGLTLSFLGAERNLLVLYSNYLLFEAIKPRNS